MVEFFNISYIVYTGILTFLFIVVIIRNNLLNKIPKLISSAEEEMLSGKEKMIMVISYAKSLVPRLFRVLFNDKVLEQMAQNIYNDMKSYRENYITRKSNIEQNKTK